MMQNMFNSIPIVTRVKLSVVFILTVCLLPLLVYLEVSWAQGALVTFIGVILAILVTSFVCSGIKQGLDALELGLQNFKDGEFSNKLAYIGNDQLGQLCELYNHTAEKLRQEKQWIYQRELMLDKVLESAPQALLLVNSNDVVVFCNLSAQNLLAQGSRLEGMHLTQALAYAPTELNHAIEADQDGLFNLLSEQEEVQTWHLANGQFLLNNQQHKLYIFKQLTRELNRQEVAVWKKVIRIISHELNNSLGPMSSMLHSGKILTQNLDEPRLQRVFSTIEERIKHLTEFVQGYGKFAKLPQPKLEEVDWHKLNDELSQQWQFETHIDLPSQPCYADNMQLQQLLINLLKNAHESGSDADKVKLRIEQAANGVMLSVEDEGMGMSEQVMANALVPFYSTKASGSGLGLALCREIVEAHHGYLSLHSAAQKGGQSGLVVKVFIPFGKLAAN